MSEEPPKIPKLPTQTILKKRPDSEQTLLIPSHDIYLEMPKKGNKNLSSSRKRVKSSENIEVRMTLSD